MQLTPPCPAPELTVTNIFGNEVALNSGKPTLLSFYRDSNCPFCNLRVHELTQRYEDLAFEGMNVIAIFPSSLEQVQAFVMHRPRPFTLVSDPEYQSYKQYGIGSSFLGKLLGIVLHPVAFMRGLPMVKSRVLKANNVLPADFLITPDGEIEEAFYASNIGERIDFARVENFARKYRDAARPQG